MLNNTLKNLKNTKLGRLLMTGVLGTMLLGALPAAAMAQDNGYVRRETVRVEHPRRGERIVTRRVVVRHHVRRHRHAARVVRYERFNR